MALIKCKECSEQVSSDAKACPHCGTKKFKPPGVGDFIGLVFVILFMIGYYKSSEQRTKDAEAKAAVVAAEVTRVAALPPEQQKIEAEKNRRKIASEEEADRKGHAAPACMRAIELKLKDPSSAEFDDIRTSTVEKRKKDGAYVVTIGVKARNSFNGITYSQFGCVVKEKNGEWFSLNVEELR